MKKVKSLLLVAVLAVAIFVILLAIERHEISKYERIEMAVVKADVPKGTKISKDNLSTYFEIRECDNSLQTSYNVTELTELEGQYVKTTLYANTIVNREDFQNVSFANENIKNKVKGSFSVASISDGMNGMLRMGDVVQLYVVNTVGGICEEVLPYKVIIEEAFDTNGILITAGDNTTVATNFNVGIDKQDEAVFYKNISNGNVKVVLADSEAVTLMSESDTHKNATEDSGNKNLDDDKESKKETVPDVLNNQDKSEYK